MVSNINLINENNLRDRLSMLSSQLNVSKWDLGASISKDISVQIDKSQPKQLKASQKSSITIRVWNKSQVGITSTSDLSELGLRKALSSALQASHFGNKEQTPDFSICSKESLPKLDKPLRKQYGVKKLLGYLTEAEDKLLNRDKSIKSVPYNGFAKTMKERL